MHTNDRIRLVAAGLASAWVLLGTAASAEPLRDVAKPLCSTIDAEFATGTPEMSANCRAPLADGRREILEISLTAARGPAQIGDFNISDAYLYNSSYTPEVWSVDPGDSLLIHLNNKLSGTAAFRTNLHTHGMVVSPNNAPGTPKSPVGDSVFALIYSKDATAEQRKMHTPENPVPIRNFDETAEILIEVPQDHPKGLFWYHPHPHSISSPQVIGGMSGFLTVGRPSDYIAPELKRGTIEEKLLMLKDTQVTRTAGANQWRVNDQYDPANCGDSAKKEPGICFKDNNNAWLFPVNGQIYPTIEVKEGVGQLWRIGNIGANATYQLELVEIAGDGTESPLPFQVISIDGLAVDRDPGDKPIMREKLLVMPSARIEVLVTHPGSEGEARKAVFRTTGFDTGVNPNVGDNWPAIDLAQVVFEDSLADSNEDSGLAFVKDQTVFDFGAGSQTSSNADCPGLAKDEVRIVAFDVPPFTNAQKKQSNFTPPPGCMVNQEYDIIGNVVTKLSDDSSFETILSAYDKALDGKYSRPFGDGSPAYRGKCFNGALDTCVPYPSVQDWWVVNASNEAHNFHIHQTRFQVLEVRGAGANFSPIKEALADNYPVLAGQAIKVRIALNRPEQIGYFVYHCHILQHEDAGMMAAIEVRKVE